MRERIFTKYKDSLRYLRKKEFVKEAEKLLALLNLSLVPRLSPSTRAIYVRIINAYVNCARGGGEPGNEAN